MKLSALLPPLLSATLLILLWEALIRLFHVPAYLMPAPSRIWSELVEMLPFLWPHVKTTMGEIFFGFAFSCLIAIPLGIVIALSRLMSRTLYPILIFLNAVPVLAVAPIIVVMLGTGMEARLIIILMVAFFPVMVATIAGVLDTPQALIDLGQTVGNSLWRDLVTIRLPHAAPFIFSGLKIGMSLSVIGAVVGEFITAQRGLGYLIISSTTNFDLARAMAAVVILALLSVALLQAIQLLQRLITPWSVSSRNDR